MAGGGIGFALMLISAAALHFTPRAGALVGVEVARSPDRCFAMRHPFDEYGRKTKVGAREGSPSVDL